MPKKLQPGSLTERYTSMNLGTEGIQWNICSTNKRHGCDSTSDHDSKQQQTLNSAVTRYNLLRQWDANPTHQVAWQSKVSIVACNRCGNKVRNWLHLAQLASSILRWLQSYQVRNFLVMWKAVGIWRKALFHFKVLFLPYATGESDSVLSINYKQHKSQNRWRWHLMRALTWKIYETTNGARDLKQPSPRTRDLLYFGILRSVECRFLTDGSGQHIGPKYKGQAAREHETDRSSRNVGQKLTFYAA